MPTHWFKIALSNFFIAALIGVSLRFAYIQEIPFFKYKNLLHAHSHVAMLGWLYLALYGLLLGCFISPEKLTQRTFKVLFWVTQCSVWGMLLSFPFQGYGPVSITFSTLHILCSYVFAHWMWCELSRDDQFSAKLLRMALVFMVLSTLGVWMMAPLTVLDMRYSIWYHLAVQFYLHFQFNGWLLIAALALLFRWLEGRGVHLARQKSVWFYRLLLMATLCTFALAVAWSEPHPMVFFINSLGVLLQLAALLLFATALFPFRFEIKKQLSLLNFNLWRLAFISLSIKAFIQAAVVVPVVAKMAYTIRNYIIGFIHLMMLGVLSFFILGMVYQQTRSLALVQRKIGLTLLSSGIVFSEALLFLQGTLFWAELGFIPHYHSMLFALSCLMPLGVGVLMAESKP